MVARLLASNYCGSQLRRPRVGARYQSPYRWLQFSTIQNENDIRNYILHIASFPANVKVTADGKQRLNYRNLDIKIGAICYVLTQERILILERSPWNRSIYTVAG